MRALARLFYISLMLTVVSAAIADGDPITITVHPDTPVEGVGPVSREMIGVNLPVHTDQRSIELSALSGPGTNGVYEALKDLNIGLIRQWSPAPECGIHSIAMPPHNPATDGPWEAWLRQQLAVDSPHWAAFDRYIEWLSELGDDVHVMLCLPSFPVWLGPYRWQGGYRGQLVNTETGAPAQYEDFINWAGIDKNCIGDIAHFEVFRGRVSLYVQVLVEHILSKPVLRKTIRSIEVGNEPDNGGDIVQNETRWRMFVYAMGSKQRREQGGLLPTDQGLLQQVFPAIRDGLRAADPEGSILLCGPSCAWAHNQKASAGALYYLDYFIKGAQGIRGVGAESLDCFTYHNYGHTYRHDEAVATLFAAYGLPVYLTEYNATAAGHGMNFMQTGATAVANVFAQLAQIPNVRGAAFFKAAGGGFGLVLNRDGVLWHTGAYWTLKALSEEFVGGRPLAWQASPDMGERITCLVVATDADPAGYALLTVNLTDEQQPLAFDLGMQTGNVETHVIALPIARERDDYRNVEQGEIRSESLKGLSEHLILPARGVLILRWQPKA